MLSKCILWCEKQKEANIPKLTGMRQVHDLSVTEVHEKLVKHKIMYCGFGETLNIQWYIVFTKINCLLTVSNIK